MSLPMLVVDWDLDVTRREQTVWEKRGIGTVRADTMCKAIVELTRRTLLFTAIDADNIHYMPMLKIMDEVSPTPIFIITSHFSLYDQVEAMQEAYHTSRFLSGILRQ